MLSFKVKNLGVIAEAEFSAAPLTLLVGQNNTGKSYLATLIWMLARPSMLLSEGTAEAQRPKWLDELHDRFERPQPPKLSVGGEHAGQLIAYIQSIFERSGSDILKKVFNYDGFENCRIQFSVSEQFEPFDVVFTSAALTLESKPNEKQEFTRVSIVSKGKGLRRTYNFRQTLGRRRSLFADRIIMECVGLCLFGVNWDNYRLPIYIPAARTGLMLALRPLIAQSLEFDEAESTPLPLPISDFLSRFVRAGVRTDRDSVADWLEKTVLHGTLDMSEDEIPTINYIPERSATKVPLHATSSMITEMAPFIHLIRNVGSGHFIFEEPEAHLHLSAQRQMARAIARLLNAGAKFTITTHSDTFVQQINNLMRLHNHPEKDTLLRDMGYEESDLINPAQAKAYEFVKVGDGTQIKEVARTPEGFVVPTLNETLLALSRETIELTEED